MVHFIDPYDPENQTRMGNQFKEMVLMGLKLLSAGFDECFAEQRQWRAAFSSQIAEKYIFPKQPPNNGSDCGVLVCLHMGDNYR